eukprot:8378528-Ditylum_brightwellii.AAC.1
MSPEVQDAIKEVIKERKDKKEQKKNTEVNTVEGIDRTTLQEQTKIEKTITMMMSLNRKRNLKMNNITL